MRKRLSVNETKKFYGEKNVRQTGADEGLFCRVLLLIFRRGLFNFEINSILNFCDT